MKKPLTKNQGAADKKNVDIHSKKGVASNNRSTRYGAREAGKTGQVEAGRAPKKSRITSG